MIRDVLVFRKLGEIGFFETEPVPCSPLCRVAQLLFFGHVRPANPVLIFCLALQIRQSVALHLPGNLSWTTVLSNPLLAGDAFPQQGDSEEHDASIRVQMCYLKKNERHKCNLE